MVTNSAEDCTDQIFIRNLLLKMYLGVNDHEKKRRQKVNVCVEAWIVRPDKCSDDISSTVSYSDIAEEIRGLAAAGKYGLAESFCEVIADTCLNKHSAINKISVTVDKPEACFDAETVGVKITRLRKD